MLRRKRFSVEKAWTAYQREGMKSDAGQRKTEFDEIIAKVVPGDAKLTPTTVSSPRVRLGSGFITRNNSCSTYVVAGITISVILQFEE